MFDITERSTCKSCGAFYAPGYLLKEEGVCRFCGKKTISRSILNSEELLDEIRLLLIDATANPCGGLFAAEIQLGLFDKGIEASTQRIVDLIRYRGKHIKIQPITVGSKWVNMYYTAPPLDLEEADG